MHPNEIAPEMLAVMPFTFAAKTIAVAWATWMLSRQRSDHDYGAYAVRFFVFLTVTSAALTGMFGRLAWVFYDAEALGIWLWWMVPLEVASVLVAYYGVRMVLAERRLP